MQTEENQNASNQIKFLDSTTFRLISDVRILSTKSQHFLPSQTKANAKQKANAKKKEEEEKVLGKSLFFTVVFFQFETKSTA